VVALEYLSVPYFFMIFIDLYLSGRLSAFSWRNFIQFLRGTFFHPRSTFEEICHRRSILFSLVAVILVSLAWIVRTVALSATDFVPVRWLFIPLILGESLELVSKTVLIVPAMIPLLGFAFLPSVITIIVDFFEAVFYPIKNSLALNLVFLTLGFIFTLVLWPLLLSTFALQTSENLSFRSASVPAIVIFLPLFILFALVFS